MSGGDVDLARVAELIGDPSRGRMLLALLGGREIAAGLLADEAGVSRSTASAHLARLVEGGLVSVRSHGRHRHYRISDSRVAEAIERLIEIAPTEPVDSLRSSRRAARLRVARTCYDHVAGQVGVGLMQGLISGGHLVGGDGIFDDQTARTDRPAAPGHDIDYRLTEQGVDFLDALGVRLPHGRRPLVRYCVDWTETRHHLGGRLGRGLCERFLEAGWLLTSDTPRVLVPSDEGKTVLREQFGLALRS